MCVIPRLANIAVIVCLGLPLVALANSRRIGHTINNGGGNAELILTDLSRQLERRLNVCMHSINPCGLSVQQRQIVERIQSNLLESVPVIENEQLYDAGGIPLSRNQISELLLKSIFDDGCSQLLLNGAIDWTALREQVESVKTFSALDLETVIIHQQLRGHESLILVHRRQTTDLLGRVRVRLGITSESIRITELSVRAPVNGLEIRGRVSDSQAVDAAFMILYNSLADTPQVLITEGGRGDIP